MSRLLQSQSNHHFCYWKKNFFLIFTEYDPRKEELTTFKVQHQSQVLRNLFQEQYVKVGCSRGHLPLSLPKKKQDLYLVNLNNKKTLKVIVLPPLKFHYKSVNMSVSYGKMIVAVKTSESELGLWGFSQLEWDMIKLPSPWFQNSRVMYSERYRGFYLHNCKGYNGPLHLAPESRFAPVNVHANLSISNRGKLEEDFPNFPIFQFLESSLSWADQHIFEAPLGKSYIVYRFVSRSEEKGKNIFEYQTPKIIVVEQYKQQQTGENTNDIGDLSIFIGPNEGFYASSKEIPGLKPNSIYFTTDKPNFGIYDLFSRKVVHANSIPHFFNLMVWISSRD